MDTLGKTLIIAGLLIAVAGVAILYAPKLPYVGRLPGDILIKKEKFVFYFPLATSIILSLIVSIILYLIGRR